MLVMGTWGKCLIFLLLKSPGGWHGESFQGQRSGIGVGADIEAKLVGTILVHGRVCIIRNK